MSEDVRYGSVAPVWVHRKLNKRRRRKLNKRNKRLRSCVSKRFINKSVIFEPHRRGKVVRCGSIELCEAFDASPLRSDVEALRKSLPGGAARDRTMGPRYERACVCVCVLTVPRLYGAVGGRVLPLHRFFLLGCLALWGSGSGQHRSDIVN